MPSNTLYLASQSPRRSALIKLLGIPKVTVLPAHVIEIMLPHLNPRENVEQLARQKAEAVAESISEGIVLGADTTVFLEGEILNKPVSAEDAERMLRQLSGRTHTVLTGVALTNAATKETISFVEATDVTFRNLNSDEISAYVASGSPMDKAGAYGIQEDFGAVFVRQIDGDYYNVVGLPICRLYVTLKSFAPELF